MVFDTASYSKSTGLVRAGKEWVLIRYELLPQPAVYKSSLIFLPLLYSSPENEKEATFDSCVKAVGS